MASIDESYTDNVSDEGYIRTNNIKKIWDGSKYIQRLTQNMLDFKYVTVLDKLKMN